jgi:hypothetical protein
MYNYCQTHYPTVNVNRRQIGEWLMRQENWQKNPQTKSREIFQQISGQREIGDWVSASRSKICTFPNSQRLFLFDGCHCVERGKSDEVSTESQWLRGRRQQVPLFHCISIQHMRASFDSLITDPEIVERVTATSLIAKQRITDQGHCNAHASLRSIVIAAKRDP